MGLSTLRCSQEWSSSQVYTVRYGGTQAVGHPGGSLKNPPCCCVILCPSSCLPHEPGIQIRRLEGQQSFEMENSEDRWDERAPRVRALSKNEDILKVEALPKGEGP